MRKVHLKSIKECLNSVKLHGSSKSHRNIYQMHSGGFFEMGHVDEKGKQNPKQPPPYPWKTHLCCGGCRHAGGAAVSGEVCAKPVCAVSVRQRQRVRGRSPGAWAAAAEMHGNISLNSVAFRFCPLRSMGLRSGRCSHVAKAVASCLPPLFLPTARLP